MEKFKRITVVLVIIGLVSCSSKPKKHVVSFDKIQPKTNHIPSKNKLVNDTLGLYLVKFNQDSVALGFDSIQIDNSLLFLDRFIVKQQQPYSRLILKNKVATVWFGEWKFKDTLSRKNAFFNWLDHFGPSEIQLDWLGREKICQAHLLILVNKQSIIQIISSQRIDSKSWEAYQRINHPTDSLRIKIEQLKGKSCKWIYPTNPKSNRNENNK